MAIMNIRKFYFLNLEKRTEGLIFNQLDKETLRV